MIKQVFENYEKYLLAKDSSDVEGLLESIEALSVMWSIKEIDRNRAYVALVLWGIKKHMPLPDKYISKAISKSRGLAQKDEDKLLWIHVLSLLNLSLKKVS